MTDQKNNQEEIQVVDLLKTMWINRKKIVAAAFIGAVIGIVVAFSIPKTYVAYLAFAPETERQMGSGVSSIASMMGVNLDNSVDAISVEMFPDVVATTPFCYALLDLQIQTVDGLNTDLMDYLSNHQKYPWWTHVMASPFRLLAMFKTSEPVEEVEYEIHNLPRSVRKVIRDLSKSIVVETHKKTGKTAIHCRMQDPLVAYTVLTAVVENLKNYMTEYRTSKDRQVVENLKEICKQRQEEYYLAQKVYADFVDANKNLILQSAQVEQQKLQQEMQLAYQVYSQVASQLEGARIKEQQSKPVFVILEPAMIPEKKSTPSRSKILLAFTLLGGACAAAWVLFADDIKKTIKNL